MYRVSDEITLQLWRNILMFTFASDFVRKFFPYTNRMPFIDEAKNPVVIPISASTLERQQKQFAKFTYLLARHLKIMDTYRAIWIKKDREQLKGTSGKNKLANLRFNEEYIKGKDIFLIDDILTSAQSFIQTKQKMEELGANSVVGLFLGRTA